MSPKSVTTWLVLALGIVLGVLLLGGARYVAYSAPDQVHYHANFAVFVNGHQEPFKDPALYEETSSCTLAGSKTPMERAHMHDMVNNVVHVEDAAVTWGQFFENVGWTTGTTFVSSPSGLYANGDQGKVTYTLNGQTVMNISSTVIRDNDKLLVSYGNTSASELTSEYNGIPATAHRYDVTKDPKSCMGHTATTMGERLNYAFHL